MKLIIFPQDNGNVAVMAAADCGLTIEQVAAKDVPTGKPYLIVDQADLPDAPQESWDVDFSNPTGYGA